jgi:hypothetical protein
MEADMKKFILGTVLAVILTTGEIAPAISDRDLQTNGSFVTAQRYCPNGRC